MYPSLSIRKFRLTLRVVAPVMLALASLPVLVFEATGFASTDFGPAWLDQYKATSPSLDGPSLSYLLNTRGRWDQSGLEALAFDGQQAPVLRQRYEDMSRDYEMRARYGLTTPSDRQARVGQVQGFGHDVLNDQENRRIEPEKKLLSDKVTEIYEHDKTLRTVGTVVSPAAVAAGIYMGTPIRMRVADNTLLSLRTDFRGHNGTFEVDSPIAHGIVDFHPDAVAQRELVPSTTVDFGQIMNLGQVADYSQERYLFSVYRQLPLWDLRSSFFYGSSSNAVAGSLSKQLTGNLTCALDSVHALAPYPDAPSSEEKVRFVYDFHF